MNKVDLSKDMGKDSEQQLTRIQYRVRDLIWDNIISHSINQVPCFEDIYAFFLSKF